MLQRLYSTLALLLAALLIFGAMPMVVSAGTQPAPCIMEVGTVLKTIPGPATCSHINVKDVLLSENIINIGSSLSGTAHGAVKNLSAERQTPYIVNIGLPYQAGALPSPSGL